MDIRLFGPLDVRAGGQPLPRLRSRKGGWLLALLALRYNREVTREFLMAALWPDAPPEQAAASLRQSLTDLRRALGASASRLRSPTPRTLMLALEAGEADVAAFDQAIAAGDIRSMETAAALYRGPLLEGCSEEWVVQERDSREQAWLTALERLASHEMESGRPDDAARHLRRAVACDPLRESAQRGLMLALARGGDHAAAVVAYRDLRLLLRRELNSEPDAATTAIYEQLRAEARLKAHTTAGPKRGKGPAYGARAWMPCAATEIVGREREAEEVLQTLDTARLVTLTGPGGVGKTRLATHVAERRGEDGQALAWFVDLSLVSDAGLVTAAIAAAIGVPDGPADGALERVAAFVRPDDALLVLDNCEQVVDAAAQTVAALLVSCPRLRILATSRQVLGVVGEAVYPVPPLTVPPAELPMSEAGHEPQHLMQFEAVRLFVMRARFALPGFALTAATGPAVAEICRRLDGIPLALELAAARVRAMPPNEIAAHLVDRFDLLTSGRTAGPERHRALAETMAWSYRMLGAEEQALLRRLSVFSGGWTHDAAEAVCDDAIPSSHHPIIAASSSVLDLLVSLVDKSLVVHDWQSGNGRYRLLETVRQFALRRLAESGEEAQVRVRHRAYYLELGEQARAWERLPAEGWFESMAVEHDNMRAAMDFSLGRQEAEVGLRFARALALYWLGHCRVEGTARLRAALCCRGADRPTPLRARVLLWAAESLWGQGGHAAAQAYAEESLQICEDADDPSGIAWSLEALGDAAYGAGRFAEAQDHWEQSLARLRALGDAAGQAVLLGNLGEVHRREGRRQLARAHYEESRDLARSSGSQLSAALAAANLAAMACEQDDPWTAAPLLREALEGLWRTGCHWLVPLALPSVAAVALARGDHERAARLLGASEALRERLGTVVQPADAALWDRCLAQLGAPSSGGPASSAWSAGRAMTMQSAVEYALGD